MLSDLNLRVAVRGAKTPGAPIDEGPCAIAANPLHAAMLQRETFRRRLRPLHARIWAAQVTVLRVGCCRRIAGEPERPVHACKPPDPLPCDGRGGWESRQIR